jgi:hypothetical protein
VTGRTEEETFALKIYISTQSSDICITKRLIELPRIPDRSRIRNIARNRNQVAQRKDGATEAALPGAQFLSIREGETAAASHSRDVTLITDKLAAIDYLYALCTRHAEAIENA